MPSIRRGPAAVRAGTAAAVTALALVASANPAGAAEDVQLNGEWAPFTRCAVDNPAMLAADGKVDTALCISSKSASGTIKIGSQVVPIGKTDLQAGVVTHPGGLSTVVPPAEGALLAAPADLPGGLLGLMCPNDVPLVSDICKQLTDNKLNRVTAYVESAGTPTNFKLLAGVSKEQPILSLPVRIRLENPFLGDKCYLGTKSDPIVLRPQNATVPTVRTGRFAGNGTPDPTGPLNRLSATGATQQDLTFAVPGASGCGLLGSLDWAVNLKSGLPAKSGVNSLELKDPAIDVATTVGPSSVAPNQGKLFAEYWHSAKK